LWDDVTINMTGMNVVFSPVAIIAHTGSMLDGGHYLTFVRQSNGVVSVYDDSVFESVAQQKYLRKLTIGSYVALCVRK